jgi:hypothetical protein
MHHAIEKSGTGINKSGTGIEKSGTGIERSGTGAPRARRASMTRHLLVGLVAFASTCALASEPRVLLTETEQSIRLSIHVDQTIVAGEIALSGGSPAGLMAIDLHDALSIRGDRGVQSYGSGTGSESGAQSYGSGTGSENCGERGAQSYGSGTGSYKPCATSAPARWGKAELVFDSQQIFILIHRDSHSGPVEVLATSQSRHSRSGSDLPAPNARIALSSDWVSRN